MSIVRYNTSLNDFVPTSFSTLVDRFFNESVTRSGGSSYSFVPRVDVLEDEKAFEIHVAAPGVNKDDFKLDINNNMLTISGERKSLKEKKDVKFHTVETQYGTFSRSFSLPDNVDAGKVTAAYHDGILVINVPKDEKKILKTTIKVN